MKKGFLLLAVLMMVFALVLCACEDKKEEAPTEDINKVVDPTDVDKLIISLGDASCKIGEKFEDVKGRFGAERKPANSYTPCGGSDDAKNTTHYYDGLEIEEVASGIVYYAKISGFDYPTSQASIAGIKLGDTPETVRAHFGSTPDTDSEYVINYTFGTICLSFGLDNEETGNVNHISMDDMSLGGV